MKTPYLAVIATALFMQACDRRDQAADAQRMQDTDNTSYSQTSAEPVINEPIVAAPAPSAAVDQGDTVAAGAVVKEDKSSDDVAAAAVVDDKKSEDDVAAAPIVTEEAAATEEPYEVTESGYLEDDDMQAMEEDEWSTEDQEKQAMEEDRFRQYDSKTYNELQISDDSEDYPITKDTGSMTYNEWQSDEGYTK